MSVPESRGTLPAFFAVLLFALLCLNRPVGAETLSPPEQQVLFEQGTAAYDAGNYTDAYDIWLPLARKNDLAAQRNIGHLFHHGFGVEKDPERAFYWYKRAADAGLASAQANVGVMYLTGDGVQQDKRQAADYLYKAARAGHTVAQYNMAVMFDRGVGIKADPIKAMAFYYLAARGDHEAAQARLAELVTASETLLDQTDYVALAEEKEKEAAAQQADQETGQKTGFFVLDMLSAIFRAAGAQPSSTEPDQAQNGALDHIEEQSATQNQR